MNTGGSVLSSFGEMLYFESVCVNETVLAQLTSPTPIIQDQIAQRFLIYGYARGTGECYLPF
jgi:hypothetical protein